MSSSPLPSFEVFRALPHAFSLLGMSGVGKTMLSSRLRRVANWYHYSADYRIGTRYLSEDILDNIKQKIMQMEDRFVADLLRSDSIYINHNISVDNLDPVSTFLGMYGDPERNGLPKAEFLRRQDLYRRAEVATMLDVPGFIDKAWTIYGCESFINDASGSLCEIVDIEDADDPVIRNLGAETLTVYLRSNPDYEAKLVARAQESPKPLFYNPAFITPRLADMPDDGAGVDPLKFAGPMFPELIAFRRPRYERYAELYGFSLDASDLFKGIPAEDGGPGPDDFLRTIHDVLAADIASGRQGAAELTETYIRACEARREARRG
jgi:hypothetical protein